MQEHMRVTQVPLAEKKSHRRRS